MSNKSNEIAIIKLNEQYIILIGIFEFATDLQQGCINKYMCFMPMFATRHHSQDLIHQ